MEKVSVFIKVRVLFWPEISAIGVFLNFDNERMRIFPGVSNCLIVAPAYDRGYETCDKSKALLNHLEYNVM